MRAQLHPELAIGFGSMRAQTEEFAMSFWHLLLVHWCPQSRRAGRGENEEEKKKEEKRKEEEEEEKLHLCQNLETLTWQVGNKQLSVSNHGPPILGDSKVKYIVLPPIMTRPTSIGKGISPVLLYSLLYTLNRGYNCQGCLLTLPYAISSGISYSLTLLVLLCQICAAHLMFDTSMMLI